MLNQKNKLIFFLLILVFSMVSFPLKTSAATTCNMSIAKDDAARTVYITGTVQSNTGGDYDGISINWGDSVYAGTQIGSMNGTTDPQEVNVQHTYYSADTYDINLFTESRACNVWGQVSFNAEDSIPGSVCESTTNDVLGSWYLTAPDGVTNYSITNTSNNCSIDVPGSWTIWGIQNISGYGAPTITPSSSSQYLPSGGSISWVIDYPAGESESLDPSVPTISGVTSGYVDTNYTFNLSSSDPSGKQIRYGIDWSDPFDGVADEWLPSVGAPTILTTTWSKVSGPGTVTFANSVATATTATFGSSGTYNLRLSATNGTISASDDLIVTVNPSSIAYWNFNESVGATSFADSSGNSTTATCNNGCPSSGNTGNANNAVGFDGSSSSLQLSYNVAKPIFQINGSDPFTIAVWIKPNVSVDGWRGIVGGDYTSNWLVCGGDNTNSVGFYVQGTRLSTPANSIPLNTWTHVAVTFDGTTKSIYLNGVLSVQDGVSGINMSNSGSPLYIGSNSSGSNFSGLIDDLRVYDKSLSASEVQAIATAVAGTPDAGTTNQTLNVNAGADQVITLPSTASLSGLSTNSASSVSYVNSGVSQNVSHSWSTIGTKQFKVLSQNTDGTNSSWSSAYSVAITNAAQNAICGSKAGGPSTNTRYYSGGETNWYVGDTECYVGTAAAQTFPVTSVTWTCAGVNGGTSASCTAFNSNGGSNKTVTVTLSNRGGSVVSQPAGVTCSGTTCTGVFPVNTSVKLVPVPDSIYWKFTGWSGACSGTLSCTINMNADKAVNAVFVPRSSVNSEF